VGPGRQQGCRHKPQGHTRIVRWGAFFAPESPGGARANPSSCLFASPALVGDDFSHMTSTAMQA